MPLRLITSATRYYPHIYIYIYLFIYIYIYSFIYLFIFICTFTVLINKAPKPHGYPTGDCPASVWEGSAWERGRAVVPKCMAQYPEATKPCLAPGCPDIPHGRADGLFSVQVQRPQRQGTALARTRPPTKRGVGQLAFNRTKHGNRERVRGEEGWRL